jgi:opacity protein-like surface antigen
MKKVFFLLTLISLNVIIAQENKPFSVFDIGFYGGMNFNKIDNRGGDFLVELKTNIITALTLKASLGYTYTVQPYTKTVKSYSENLFMNEKLYFAGKYNLISKNYDMLPIGLGIQYNFSQSIISPYLSVDAVYNLIDTHIETSPSQTWSYTSIDEIPDEFKQEQRTEVLPTSSTSLITGAGVAIKITSKLNLDLRYMFKFDSETINTNHLIVGIYF